MNITAKQISIIGVIVAGNPDGSPADLDEIIERINYDTTKASIQFSIRSLIAQGVIEKAGMEKRRGRKRVLIVATAAGRALVGSRESFTGDLSYISEDFE